MILVDSSVWIDYFRGTATPQAERLDSLLGTEPVATGDLILTEVLRGFVSDRDFNQAKKLLTSLVVVGLVGQDIAIKAAKNFCRPANACYPYGRDCPSGWERVSPKPAGQ